MDETSYSELCRYGGFPELSLTGHETELAERLDTNQDDIQNLSDINKITIGVGLPAKIEGNVFVSRGLLF